MILSVRLILPALNSAGQYDYSDRIDVGAMIADPVGAVVDLVSGTAKHETLLLLLLAGGVLFLRSSLSLVLLPTLLWRFASTQGGYWGPEWHYSAVLMPVLFLALLDGVHTLRTSRRGWVRSTAMVGIPAAVAACLVLLPGQKFTVLAEPETYRQSERWDAAHRMMDLIPEGSTVESGVVLMPTSSPTPACTGSATPTRRRTTSSSTRTTGAGAPSGRATPRPTRSSATPEPTTRSSSARRATSSSSGIADAR